MKYLLGVNALLAAILAIHSRHQVADTWLRRKLLATCPLSELGFLRISTHPKAYNLPMAIARKPQRPRAGTSPCLGAPFAP
jgi:predicted nucleic acid-binding protein